MNLQEVREQAAKISGRVDLVSPTGEDEGMDFYIRAGQRFLDFRTQWPGQDVELEIVLPQGEIGVKLSSVRAVEAVRLGDKLLTRVQAWEIGSIPDGLPTAYAVLGNEDEDLSIVFSARPSSEVTVSVWALLGSKPLQEDGDENWWSVEHPDVLIHAALFKLEQFYRNTQGAQDHLSAVDEALRGIDNEVVARESADIRQVRNSWRAIRQLSLPRSRHS